MASNRIGLGGIRMENSIHCTTVNGTHKGLGKWAGKLATGRWEVGVGRRELFAVRSIKPQSSFNEVP